MAPRLNIPDSQKIRFRTQEIVQKMTGTNGLIDDMARHYQDNQDAGAQLLNYNPEPSSTIFR